MADPIPPTPCPHCGTKLGLGADHMKKKMRCPKCGCRFIAGTGKVLSPGKVAAPEPAAVSSERAAPEKPLSPPVRSTGGGIRKVRCILCDFEVESGAPSGASITCPMCNSVFSEPAQPEPARAALKPAAAPPPPPKPSLDLLEEETPTRTPVLPPSIPVAPSAPMRIAPTEQAPRDVLADQPLVARAAPARGSMIVMGRPVEVLVVAALSGILGIMALVGVGISFGGSEGLARGMIGSEGDPKLILPLVTIASAVALLGLWKREPWGWFAGAVAYGIGTLLFAVRMGQGEIVPAGAAAAVCLILLIFSRLSGRYD